MMEVTTMFDRLAVKNPDIKRYVHFLSPPTFIHWVFIAMHIV
jgi:hypothetical protein